MVECARDFMLFIDIITFLLGIAILGVSIYAVIEYSYFSSVLSFNTIYISMAVGGVLMLVACLGCVASRHGHKCLLCLYLVIVTLALAAQIAATILIADFAGALGSQSSLISSSITTSADQVLNNAILSTYVACCEGCPAIQGCNNGQTYFNDSLPFCTVGNVAGGAEICGPVPICNSSNPDATDGCFQGNPTLIPPVSPDKAICVTFQQFTNASNVPLVGNASTGSCGGGSPNQYIVNFVSSFHSPVYYLILAFGILCALQGLNLLAAMYVLACTRDYVKNY